MGNIKAQDLHADRSPEGVIKVNGSAFPGASKIRALDLNPDPSMVRTDVLESMRDCVIGVLIALQQASQYASRERILLEAIEVFVTGEHGRTPTTEDWIAQRLSISTGHHHIDKDFLEVAELALRALTSGPTPEIRSVNGHFVLTPDAMLTTANPAVILPDEWPKPPKF